MPYSQFTNISKAKEAFGLKTKEGGRFIPSTEPIEPSTTLTAYLQESLPLAASASEKARSEGIIYPVLLEVRRILNREISLFSGEDFTIDESIGLNGKCDFLLSRSPEVLEIEAPAIVIVEAKKADLRTGFGETTRRCQFLSRRSGEPGGAMYGRNGCSTKVQRCKKSSSFCNIWFYY